MIVMLMMLPGLGLFYAGMARSKNVLSVMTHILATIALVCVLWILFGYSLTFAPSSWMAVIGGTGKMFLSGITQDSLVGTIPEYLYVLFMMMFAAITPPLIVGAFAERMKFSAVLIFMAVWLTINYVPMAHMAWGGGWVFGLAVQDFAGGNVVHLNAGMAALVCALVVGPRQGYGTAMMAPAGPTKPQAGVIATSPAMQPDSRPKVLGRLRCTHSVAIQPSAPPAPPRAVFSMTSVAKPFAASAQPPQNASQPTHSMAPPV